MEGSTPERSEPSPRKPVGGVATPFAAMAQLKSSVILRHAEKEEESSASGPGMAPATGPAAGNTKPTPAPRMSLQLGNDEPRAVPRGERSEDLAVSRDHETTNVESREVVRPVESGGCASTQNATVPRRPGRRAPQAPPRPAPAKLAASSGKPEGSSPDIRPASVAYGAGEVALSSGHVPDSQCPPVSPAVPPSRGEKPCPKPRAWRLSAEVAPPIDETHIISPGSVSDEGTPSGVTAEQHTQKREKPKKADKHSKSHRKSGFMSDIYNAMESVVSRKAKRQSSSTFYCLADDNDDTTVQPPPEEAAIAPSASAFTKIGSSKFYFNATDDSAPSSEDISNLSAGDAPRRQKDTRRHSKGDHKHSRTKAKTKSTAGDLTCTQALPSDHGDESRKQEPPGVNGTPAEGEVCSPAFHVSRGPGDSEQRTDTYLKHPDTAITRPTIAPRPRQAPPIPEKRPRGYPVAAVPPAAPPQPEPAPDSLVGAHGQGGPEKEHKNNLFDDVIASLASKIVKKDAAENPSDGTPSHRNDNPSDGTPSHRNDNPSDGTPSHHSDNPSDGTLSHRHENSSDGTPSHRNDNPSDGTPSHRNDNPSDGTPSHRNDNPSDGTPSHRRENFSDGTASHHHENFSDETPNHRLGNLPDETPSHRKDDPSDGNLSHHNDPSPHCPVAKDKDGYVHIEGSRISDNPIESPSSLNDQEVIKSTPRDTNVSVIPDDSGVEQGGQPGSEQESLKPPPRRRKRQAAISRQLAVKQTTLEETCIPTAAMAQGEQPTGVSETDLHNYEDVKKMSSNAKNVDDPIATGCDVNRMNQEVDGEEITDDQMLHKIKTVKNLSGYGDLTGVPSGDGNPTGVPTGDRDLTGVPSGDGDLTGVPSGDGDPSGVPSGDGDPSGVPSGDGDLTGVPSGDGDLSGVPSGDGDLSGVPSGDGDLSGVSTGDGDLTEVPSGDGDLTGVPTGDGDLSGVPSGDGDLTGVPSGDEDPTGVSSGDEDPPIACDGCKTGKDAGDTNSGNRDLTTGRVVNTPDVDLVVEDHKATREGGGDQTAGSDVTSREDHVVSHNPNKDEEESPHGDRSTGHDDVTIAGHNAAVGGEADAATERDVSIVNSDVTLDPGSSPCDEAESSAAGDVSSDVESARASDCSDNHNNNNAVTQQHILSMSLGHEVEFNSSERISLNLFTPCSTSSSSSSSCYNSSTSSSDVEAEEAPMMSRQSGQVSSTPVARTKKRAPRLDGAGFPGTPVLPAPVGPFYPHSNNGFVTGGGGSNSLPYGLHPPGPPMAVSPQVPAAAPPAAPPAARGDNQRHFVPPGAAANAFPSERTSSQSSPVSVDCIPTAKPTPNIVVEEEPDPLPSNHSDPLNPLMAELTLALRGGGGGGGGGKTHTLPARADQSILPSDRLQVKENPGEVTSQEREGNGDLAPVKLRPKPRPLSWSGGDGEGGTAVAMDTRWRDSSLTGSSESDFESDSEDDEEEEEEEDAEATARESLKREIAMEKILKRKTKAFYSAREMMTTEQTFVSILKIINEDFRVFVATTRDSLGRPIVPMNAVEPILKYLPLLQKLNEDILADLKARIKNWTSMEKIADVFVQKGAFLKMYTDYIRDFESMCATLDEVKKKYPEFDAALKKFQASPRCCGMDLKHFMLKPIQRIPQYRLMLTEYLKHQTEDSCDYEDTKNALAIVTGVADHANKSMKMGDNLKQVMEIQHMLDGRFELVKPGRSLIKQGQLQKQSRKEIQTRAFFLFNDLLLCTTPITSGYYRYNQDLPLPGMKVFKPDREDPDFPNEFNIITQKRSYTLRASSPEEREEWVKALQDTIGEHARKRHSYFIQRPASVPERESAVKLGSEAPVWIPDARVTMCMMCGSQFTLTYRRHHCRCCGKVVCGGCSRGKAPLRYLNYKAARVCNGCLDQLQRVADILEREIEIYFAERAGIEEAKSRAQASKSLLTKNQLLGNRASSFGKGKGSRNSYNPGFLEVRANQKDSDMNGYLKLWEKQKWKKHWFVVRKKALYFFKASEDRAPYRSVPLLGFEVRHMQASFQGIDAPLLFEAIHKGLPSLILRAESPSSKDKWVKALVKAASP